MRQEQINIYKFSELSDDVKTKVLDEFRDFNTDHTWYDFIFEDFKEDNKFEVGKIHFSGFCSQGDGAMFEYSDYDWKSWVNELDLPEWKKAVLKACDVSVSGKHSGRYYHYNSCNHSFDFDPPTNYLADMENIGDLLEEYMGRLEQHIKSEYKTICNGIYKTLEDEYTYLTSDEAVKESIEANEYEFFQDGTLYHN